MSIIKVKNNLTVDGTWVGQIISPNEYYEISNDEIDRWRADSEVFKSIANKELIVNDGTKDFDDVVEAWKYFNGRDLPFSYLGNKLAIHSSAKPEISGKEFYLVWTGSGDYLGSPPEIGGGELLQFQLDNTNKIKKIEVHFHPMFGSVYIHEGYAKWEGGGIGDYITAYVCASATPLQTVANLNLKITPDNWVVPAFGSPSDATHGFAGQPILIPRTKSRDGEWDYSPEIGLVPNLNGTGLYKISSIPRDVHKYINRIPIEGSSYGYTRLTSNETAFLPPGYHLRIEAYSNSGNTITVSMFMEVYREQTEVP